MHAYLGPVDRLPGVALFPTREGAAYWKNSLAEDLRDVRHLPDPAETRRMSSSRGPTSGAT